MSSFEGNLAAVYCHPSLAGLRFSLQVLMLWDNQETNFELHNQTLLSIYTWAQFRPLTSPRHTSLTQMVIWMGDQKYWIACQKCRLQQSFSSWMISSIIGRPWAGLQVRIGTVGTSDADFCFQTSKSCVFVDAFIFNFSIWLCVVWIVTENIRSLNHLSKDFRAHFQLQNRAFHELSKKAEPEPGTMWHFHAIQEMVQRNARCQHFPSTKCRRSGCETWSQLRRCSLFSLLFWPRVFYRRTG